ncbi:hypothetical protein, partial [Streptomyces sp. bgisy154]|uniref:hypothetical protein n=1 Tax=Streptomyces sp. bgisy154 TaxID=3413794 RepID=UPI003D7585C7
APLPDGLIAAIGDALTPHGPTSTTAIHDAAQAAIRVLGTDRCTHHSDTHHKHHTSPVNGCPWCVTAIDPEQP